MKSILLAIVVSAVCLLAFGHDYLYVQCHKPGCSGEMRCDSVLTSIPPQYHYRCSVCGAEKVIPGTSLMTVTGLVGSVLQRITIEPDPVSIVYTNLSTNWLSTSLQRPNGDGSTTAKAIEISYVVESKCAALIVDGTTNKILIASRVRTDLLPVVRDVPDRNIYINNYATTNQIYFYSK